MFTHPHSTPEPMGILLRKCRFIQARVKELPELIAEYAELIKAGVRFKPIQAIYEEAEDTYWVWDGYHRCKAIQLAGSSPEVFAIVEEGTKDRAELLACGANAEHGQRRTNEDKRKAVRMALSNRLLQRKNWSNRQLAEHCGVSPSLVDSVVHEENKRKQGSPFKGDSSSAIPSTEDTPPVEDTTRQTPRPRQRSLCIDAWKERMRPRDSNGFFDFKEGLREDPEFRKEFEAWVRDLLA